MLLDSALSTRGDKIVVHTDKGCHILYAPTGDQASTGYRTEQVAATNTSAAVNAQTVAGTEGLNLSARFRRSNL